jgi:hypothetical protein
MPPTLQQLSRVKSRHEEWFFEYLHSVVETHGQIPLPAIATGPPNLKASLEKMFVGLRGDVHTRGERVQAHFAAVVMEAVSDEERGRHIAQQKDLRDTRTPNEKLNAAGKILTSTQMRQNFGEMVSFVGPLDFRLVVLGHPGSGKTTLSKWLAVKMAGALLSGQTRLHVPRRELFPDEGGSHAIFDLGMARVPLFIRVSEYARYLLNLDEESFDSPLRHLTAFLWRELEKSGGARWFGTNSSPAEAPGTRFLASEPWRQNQLLIILDGLDELPDAVLVQFDPTEDRRRREIRKTVHEEITKLAELMRPQASQSKNTHVQNALLITSRVRGYDFHSILPGELTHATIEPMDHAERREFFRHWSAQIMTADSEVDQGIFATLISREIDADKRLRKEVSTPQMAGLVASIGYDNWQPVGNSPSAGGLLRTLPQSRAEIFARAVDLFLARWPDRWVPAGVYDPDVARLLAEPGLLRNLLEQTAYLIHADARFSSGDVDEKSLGEFLLKAAEHCQLRWRRVCGDEETFKKAVVRCVTQDSGFMVERGVKVYAFQHRSIQEFLAASVLAGQAEASVSLERLRGYLDDPRGIVQWREVVILALGQMQIRQPTEFLNLVKSVLDSEISAKRSVPSTLLFLLEVSETLPRAQEPAFLDLLVKAVVQIFAGSEDRDGNVHWEAFFRFLSELPEAAVTQAFLESVKGRAVLAPTVAELLIRLGAIREMVHWLTPALAETLQAESGHDSAQGGWAIHRCLAHGLSLWPVEEAEKVQEKWNAASKSKRHSDRHGSRWTHSGRLLRRALVAEVAPDYLSSFYLSEYRQIARYLQFDDGPRTLWEDSLDEIWGSDDPIYNLSVYLDGHFGRHQKAEKRTPAVHEHWVVPLRSTGHRILDRLQLTILRRIAEGRGVTGLWLAQAAGLGAMMSHTLEQRRALFADALSRGTELVFTELAEAAQRPDTDIGIVACMQAVIRSFCGQGVESFKLDSLLALPEVFLGAPMAEWFAWCGHGVASDDFIYASAVFIDSFGKKLSVETLRSALGLVSLAGCHAHRHPTTFMPTVCCYPVRPAAYDRDDIPFHQLSQLLCYSTDAGAVLQSWGLESLARLAQAHENIRAECHALWWMMAGSSDTDGLAEPQVRDQHLRVAEIADSIALPYYRTRYLIRMLPHLDEPSQRRVVERCLSDLKTVVNSHERVLVAEQLDGVLVSGNVAPGIVKDFVLAVRQVWEAGLDQVADPANRSLALARASVVLFRDRRERVLVQAVKLARNIKAEDFRAEVLRQIGPMAVLFPRAHRAHGRSCRSIRNKVWRNHAQGRDAAMLAAFADTVSPERPGFLACNLLATATAFHEALSLADSDRGASTDEMWQRAMSDPAAVEVLLQRGRLEAFDLTLQRAMALDEMIRNGAEAAAQRLLPLCVNPVPQVLPLASRWALHAVDAISRYGRLIRGEILKRVTVADLPEWQDLLEQVHDRTRQRAELCIRHQSVLPKYREHRLSVLGMTWLMAWGKALAKARKSGSVAGSHLSWFFHNLMADAPELVTHVVELAEAGDEVACLILRHLEAPHEACAALLLEKFQQATTETLVELLLESLVRSLDRGYLKEPQLGKGEKLSIACEGCLMKDYLTPSLDDYPQAWLNLTQTPQEPSMENFLAKLAADYSVRPEAIFKEGKRGIAQTWAMSRLVENVNFLKEVETRGASHDLQIIEAFLAWYCTLPADIHPSSLQSDVRYHFLAVAAALLHKSPGMFRGVLHLPEKFEEILHQEIQRAPSWRQRAAATELLGHLGSGSRQFVESLSKSAKDEVVAQRAAFRAMRSLREPTEEFIDAAIERLHDESGLVAFVMGRVLYTISQHDAATFAQKMKICEALAAAKEDPRSRRMVYFAHFARDPLPAHQMPRLDRHFARQLTRIWLGERSDVLERTTAKKASAAQRDSKETPPPPPPLPDFPDFPDLPEFPDLPPPLKEAVPSEKDPDAAGDNDADDFDFDFDSEGEEEMGEKVSPTSDESVNHPAEETHHEKKTEES